MKISKITFYPLLLLLIPITAKMFSNEMRWQLFDFIIMGSLLFMLGLVISFISNNSKFRKNKPFYIMFAIIVFLLLWAELAVGVFGTPFAGS